MSRVVPVRPDRMMSAGFPVNYNKVINGDAENLILRPGDTIVP
jgi:hypothetical protein